MNCRHYGIAVAGGRAADLSPLVCTAKDRDPQSFRRRHPRTSAASTVYLCQKAPGVSTTSVRLILASMFPIERKHVEPSLDSDITLGCGGKGHEI
jgi:hypothetical protein